MTQNTEPKFASDIATIFSTSFTIPPNEMITWRISLQEIPSFNSTQRQKGKKNLLATPARPQSAHSKTKSRAKCSHYSVFQQERSLQQNPLPQKRKQSTKFSPKKQEIYSWF